MSVLVLGSANMDLVVTAARAPAAGETLTGTSFRTGLGGKGLNQAVAAARCGATVAFLGCVGVDAHGDALLSGLAAEGVDVRALRRDDRRASGAALIVVTADAENRIIVVPGANAAVGVDDITALRARLDATCVLALALEIPLATVVDAVAAARESAARVVLDPAPVPRAGLPSSVYAEHVVLTPNETEAALLVGHAVRDRAGAERAARTLLDRGAGAVVLKLGERGGVLGDCQ
jgi:ribokinase